jgi:hypothetical protein
MFVKPGDLFTSADAAAVDFGKFYNGKSIINNEEYNSTIYTVVKGGVTYYSYTPSSENNGSLSSVVPPAPAGTTAVADAHTHDAAQNGEPPEENPNQFSGPDKQLYKDEKITGYVATPNGSLLKDDPKTGKVTVVSTNLPSDPNDPNRKNDVSPYTGRSESADLKKAQQDLNKPIQAKQDAIPVQPPPPPPPKKSDGS